MIVCGIDEAGRGSFIGPMVIAGVAIQEFDLPYLEKCGVRDSKLLTPHKREQLYNTILEHATGYVITRVQPNTIDNSVLFHALTDLEMKRMAKIITVIEAGRYYVDSCYADEELFGRRLAMLSGCSTIHSHSKADARFTVVAAASILAKVARDRSVSNIRRRYPVGSGYPGDKRSSLSVARLYKETGVFPSFVRKSWYTACRIAGDQRAVLPE